MDEHGRKGHERFSPTRTVIMLKTMDMMGEICVSIGHYSDSTARHIGTTYNIENDIHAIGLADKCNQGCGDGHRVNCARFKDDAQDLGERVVGAREAGRLAFDRPDAICEETLGK